MTKYIAFLQLKGGSGKSTLAANLCGFLIEQKKKVLAIDTDILQRTLSAWATLYTHKNFKCISISSTYELIEAYRQAENHYDFIITDTSSHINDIMNAALFINDLILIPTSATAPDIWAICDMVKTIEDMEKHKASTIDLRIVWNKFKETKKTVKFRSNVVNYFKYKEVKTSISEYIVYAEAIGNGKHTLMCTHQKGKAQFYQFGTEILNILDNKE